MGKDLDKITKVFLILNSIKESKFKYIVIINPKTGEKIMKIKLNLEPVSLSKFLDTFFDEGFKIEAIGKEEFNLLNTNDILNFNLDDRYL